MVANLKNYFATSESIVMAFLFGSASRGRARDDSDVDIAVYLSEGYSRNLVEAMWHDLEDLLKRDVDLLLLNRDNPTLAWSAIRGIPLLIRDYAFYLEFMLQVSRETDRKDRIKRRNKGLDAAWPILRRRGLPCLELAG